MKIFFFALSIAVGCWTPARAQSVTHIQTQSAGIATGVWVGNMFYLSGQLPSPVGQQERRISGGFVTYTGGFEAYWEYLLDKGIVSSADLSLGSAVVAEEWVESHDLFGRNRP